MNYFLLPAYNEEKNIGIIINDIKTLYSGIGSRIILINDGSNDKTEEVAGNTDRDIMVIRHERNLGLGNALKSGFNRIMEIIKPEDILITLDADNTHPLKLTREMIKEIKSGSDIVIASRYAKGGEEVGLSKIRSIGSFMVNTMFYVFFRYLGLREYTCGYRGYSGKFLLILKKQYKENLVTEPNFSAGTEILLKSILLKPVISEIPMVLRYDLKNGKSKMKIPQTLFAYFKLIAKIKKIKRAMMS